VEPAHPALLNPLIPEEMSQTILKCLQKDKRNRFQNVAELYGALEKIEGQISGSQGKVRLGRTRRERWKASRRFLAIMVLGVALVSVLIITYLNRNLWHSRSSSKERGLAQTRWVNSIAVLPFEDLSLDRSLGNVCESMTDNITTKLGSTDALKVSSRHSAQRFSGQGKSPQEIGKELTVANILESTLQILDDQLLANVNLVRTQDGFLWWSQRYTGSKTNTVKLEDDISRDVVVRLGVELTAENRGRLKRKDPKENEDYDIFLRGRHFEKRYSDYDEEEDFIQAVENLRVYADAHPDYALAYCSLGNIHEHRFALRNNPEDEQLMRLYYEKAYQIDPGLEETNLGMGWSHFYRRDYDSGYEYFKKAVELGPNNPEVNWNVGSFFRSIGLDEKAVRYYEKALVSDPLNSSTYRLCAASYMYTGQYDKGLNSIETAISLERENADFLAFSARLLLLLGRFDEAEKRLAEGNKMQPDSVQGQRIIRPLMALMSALDHDREKALSILQENQLLNLKGEGSYGLSVTSVYSLLGMKNEAIGTIQEGIRNGFSDTKMELYSYPLLQSYPYFENLRDAPQFKAVLEQQKIVYEMRIKKYKGL
jgi:TolB-like protein/Flp pilus assembly protein TadD